MTQLADLHIRLATDADVPPLRRLVNAAYQELANLGLNFTGTFQDEEITRERMQGCDVLLACLGHQIVGTLSVEVQQQDDSPPVLYLSQFGVAPEYKKQGIGRQLLREAENVARSKGLKLLELDTAQPASHLVRFYQSEGFSITQDVQWEGKSYRSYVMLKRLD